MVLIDNKTLSAFKNIVHIPEDCFVFMLQALLDEDVLVRLRFGDGCGDSKKCFRCTSY